MITSVESRNGSSEVDRWNKKNCEKSPTSTAFFSSPTLNETTETTETETEIETDVGVGSGDSNEDFENNENDSHRESTNDGSNDDTIRCSPSASVCFDCRVTVQFIRSHRDYSSDQFQNCWYQDDEVEGIQSKNFEALRRAKLQFGFLGDLRGLENYDDATQLQKGLLRSRAADRVFDAMQKGCDDDTIAKEYSSVTARSQTWAIIVGLRDQRDAEFVYREKPPAPSTQQRCS